MAIPNVNGFRVKKGNETGITKIATDAILDKAVTKAKLSQPVQTEINKIANKADIDGNYDSLTAGGAKQLLSAVYVDDNEPYNFRTAGGSADIGDRMYEEVVGGSIVWNQLIDRRTTSTTTAGMTLSVGSNHELILSGTPTGQNSFSVNKGAIPFIKDHVYMIDGCPSGGSTTTYQLWVNSDAAFPSGNRLQDTGYESGASTSVRKIKKASASSTGGNVSLYFYPNLGEVTNLVFNPLLFDLTAMFGSTIANYILTLETATAGAGVAWFRNLFPKPYYEYNAGELMSVKAGSHDTVGFNAWDEEWEVGAVYVNTGETTATDNTIRSKNFCRILPSTAYHATCSKDDGGSQNRYYLGIVFYDVNKKFISGTYVNNLTFTTPTDAAYFKITTNSSTVVYGKTYNNDICINLAWDGERNGQYEPYEKHEYPLANIELRGIPKLDVNNQLYYDGDTYASDGTVTRKYGIVDLGTLTWTAQTHATFGEYFNASVTSLGIKHLGTYSEVVHNIFTSKYVTTRRYSSVFVDKTICADGSANSVTELQLKDSAFSDGTALKSALNGVYMVYELATPTTETADTYVNPQVVDDFGTEEYTDFAVEAGDRDVAIPVGHNSQYMNNLRAKLEMAPDSPDGDGDYIVRQSNGENSYVPYTADGRLTALEAKLPAPPSTNGTYKLTATVTSNGVSYTWVAG